MNSNAQEIRSLKDTFWLENSINGDVKEIHYRTYIPHFQNKERTKYKIEPYDFLGLENLNYYFDSNRNLIKIIYYVIENEEYKVFSTEYKEYYENKIIKDSIVKNQNSDTVNYVYKYVKDSVFVFKNNNGILQYTMISNRDRNIENYKLINRESFVTEGKTFEYDNLDRLRRKTVLTSYQQPIKYTTYDYIEDTNNIFQKTDYSFENNDRIVTEYKYDSFSNTIHQNLKAKGRKIMILSYRYKFDSYNNWIERETYNSDQILVNLVKRKIIYY